jgi:recombinational DNA repair protein RecR
MAGHDHTTVIHLPAKLHQLELADRRIVQCAWCDARSFTNPCHTCAARYPASGNQSRSAS